MTSKNLSRRGLLQALGAGAFGAGLASRSANAKPAPPLDFAASPDALWSIDLPAGYVVQNDPTYCGGSILLNLQKYPYYNSYFLWLDIQSRQYWPDPAQAFTIKDAPDNFALTPVTYGNVIYITFPHGGLWAIDANSKATLWSNKVFQGAANPILINGQLVLPTYDGQVVALDLQGNKVWSYATGRSVSSATDCSITHLAGVIACAFSGVVFALDESGNFLWKYTAPGSIAGTMTAGDGQIFLMSGQSLIALDRTTGAVKWTKSLGALSYGDPQFYANYVCAITARGLLMAYPSEDGNNPWSVDLKTTTIPPIFIEDGIAYVGTGGSEICAIDLASRGQQVLTYSASSAVWLVGVENGVCYYSNFPKHSNIAAVDLGHQIHQYFCESQLMADDYAASTAAAGYQANSTWYRTQIRLIDSAAVPRANKSVKVWSSDNATLMSAGQTYQVTPTSPLWLTTDATGSLSIAVQATELSCPSLKLWGNFMGDNEAIVIYPDHDIANTLSQVNGQALSTATTFDGSPMLPKGYSAADDLATTIRQTMGVTQTSLQLSSPPRHSGRRQLGRRAGMRLAATPDTYIAYPDSTPNMTYQASAGSTERPYQSAGLSAWSLSIDGNGVAKFSSGALLTATSTSGSISDFKTFLSNAVHGAERVATIVWTKVNNVIQAVITTVENAYNLVVSAVEHAVAVVAGILKSIIGDIKKAIQWLSYIFNWDDILNSKDMIKGVVNNWFTSVEGWAGSYADQVKKAVNGGLDDAQLNVAGYTATVVKALGGTDTESNEVAHNNPIAFVGKGAEKWFSAMHWAMSKLTDNPSRHTVSNQIQSSYAQFVSTYDGVFTSVASKLAQKSAFQQLGPDLDHLLDGLGGFITNGPKRAIADIVKLVGDVGLLALQAVELVIDDILDAIPKLIAGVRDFLNQPITIFGLSDLYRTIAKAPLTLLDLTALIIAIPGTIISKAVNGVSSAVALPRAYPSLLGSTWYWFAGAFVNNILIGLQDLMGTAAFPALRFTQLGFQAALTAFTAPATGQEFKSPGEYSSWIISTCMFLLQAGGAIKSVVSVPKPDAAARLLWLTCFGGVLNFEFATAIFAGSDVRDPNVVKQYLISTFGAIPQIMKPMRSGQTFSPQTIALAGIDDVFGMTQIGLKVSTW